MNRLRGDYFSALYGASPDPWGLADRWYEQRKYDLTLAALPRPRYRSAFEAGCSVGVLTRRLAGRCDALLACDIDPVAARAAAERVAGQPHVRVERRELPEQWPTGVFDLVVLSELAYYLDVGARQSLFDAATHALEPEGHLVAVHWRHPVADYPASGDEVHAALTAYAARGGLERTVRHEELDLLLDVYSRTPPGARSVAQETGLA